MPVDLKSLRQERAKAVEDARALVDKAEGEKRDMSNEERASFDTLMSRAEALRKQIEDETALRAHEEMLERTREADDRRERDARRAGEADPMLGFRSWLMGERGSNEHVEAFRALSAGVNTEGGYLVAPEQFVTQLIKAVDDMVFVRRLATTYMVERAASLGAPELTADPADADWTTELQTGSEDSTMAFGKRQLRPHPLAKRIKVSNDLLRRSVLPAETLVRDRMGYKFAITEEKAFLTGSGDQQPLGVFTASANGISTSRDVSTGNSTTEIKADNLIEVKYSLKAQYQASAAWMFHRDAMKQIAKLKDGEGQYLWRSGLAADDPDTLLGRPMYMSEYAPNTFTTGNYVGILGDFSHYWIVDALDMQMQRLVELYAETNQTGFIARRELDGAPVLEEAFARVKLA